MLLLFLLACHDPAPPPPVAPHPIAIDPAVATRFDALLGAACDAPLPGRGMCAICDRFGRTVALVLPGDYLAVSAPDRAGTVGDGPRRIEYAVAAGHGSLRAQVLTCPDCERQMGWSLLAATAALPDLDPAVRAALQVALGWPGEPLLDEAGLHAAPAQPPGWLRPRCTDPAQY